MNSVVEATNKNIKKILVKITKTYKDWYEYLPFALCIYRTFVHTSMGATSYSLVYGMEAVLPIEVELLEAEWACSLYKQLNMIDEKHMTTMCHG